MKAARIAFVAMLIGCGGGTIAARSVPPGKTPPPVIARSADAGTDAAPAGEELPSLDELAARGSVEVPLMREVARSEDATKPTVIVAGSNDTCFRAAVAASAPVRAWFEDESHAARGAELSGSSGLVPPRGPACARRGEKLRLVVEPAGFTARAVVWQAP